MKVPNRNSFRTNSNYSELRSSQSESIRTNLKKFSISFVENRLKIKTTQSENSTQMNPSQFGLSLILTEL